MKAALYLRVSTDDQDVENQRPGLEALARRLSATIIETYQEKESAWTGGHQRELARAYHAAQRGRYQYLLVWALDRLTRGGPLATLQAIDRFRRAGVKVVSVQEPWTETPGELGDLLAALVGWVAHHESQRRSERTKAGMERARASGVKVGRPKGSRDRKPRKRRYAIR